MWMNPDNLINAKGPLSQLLPRPSQGAITCGVQKCHPPGGSVRESLWITLQTEGVAAYRGAGLLTGCQEEHLVIA